MLKKRVFRVDYMRIEYLVGFVDDEVITTELVELALDVTGYPTHQLELMHIKLRNHGFDYAHLVMHHQKYASKKGMTIQEKSFRLASIPILMEYVVIETDEREMFADEDF